MWVLPRRSSPSGCHAVWMSLLMPAADNSWFKWSRGPSGSPDTPDLNAGTDMPSVHRLLCALVVLVVAAGCASTGPIKRGTDAEQRQDYDVAVAEYTNALRAHPDDANARLALDRVKLRASSAHFQNARRLAATGKLDQALVEYELALELNPTSADIEEALRSVRS